MPLSVDYSELYGAKCARVGEALEAFKTAYEAPVRNLFVASQTASALRARRIVEKSKGRMRSFRLKMRQIKNRKQKAEREKMLITTQELVADQMTKDPITMEEFVWGARHDASVETTLDGLVKKVRDSFQLMPDEREAELERSEFWLEPSYLRASNPFPGIKMLETTRIRWELALQPSELAKWVARDLKENYRIPFDEDHPLLTTRDSIMGPSKISSTPSRRRRRRW